MTVRSAALGILGLALIAMGTYAALTVMADSSGESVAHDESIPGAATGDKLRWSTRDSLALCVEIGGQAASEVTLNEIKIQPLADALREIATDKYFDKTNGLRLAADNAEVDVGCSSDVALDCPQSNQPPVLCAHIGTRFEASDDPGPYVMHVFVLSESDLGKVLGQETIRRGPGDFMCYLDDCFEVTARLYITVDELSETQTLSQILRNAFALESIQ